MDNRPIGVFDSGVGGLTALRELAARLPGEELIYFGDTGRVPYGTRSRDTIIKYARQDVAFLRQFDLKAIVVACGTVSTTALGLLRDENSIPILGVVEPAAAAAAQATRAGTIGLIGTAATIRSGAYEACIARHLPDARVIAAACPLFVPLVENGRCRVGDAVAETVAAEYLAPLKAAGIDTLVLGCTHYPLLKEVIAAFMGSDVTLIDAGEVCALETAQLLRAQGLLSARETGAAHRYYVSDSIDGFVHLAGQFLGRDIAGQVEQVAIENY